MEAQAKVAKLMTLGNAIAPYENTIYKFYADQAKMAKAFAPVVMPGIYETMEAQRRVVEHFSAAHKFHSTVVQQLKSLKEAIRSNPEFEFFRISDLELLSANSTNEFIDSMNETNTDEFIEEKEELLEEFLLPYLERLKLDSLWHGANHSLTNKDNPDRLRHVLSSLRTILETLINRELSPLSDLSASPKFEKEFKKYHENKIPIDRVKIEPKKRIQHFTSKVEFRFLEEFTEKDIQFVRDCYKELCRIHCAEIGLSENQVRILKIKTGVIVWLLAHVNEIIKRDNYIDN